MARFRQHQYLFAAIVATALALIASDAQASGHGPTFDSVTDGSGGVIVVWEDSRYGERNIYAQRLDSLGAHQWPDTGVVICAAPGHQYGPVAAPDGAGGAVIAWNDERGGNSDIYAQRVDGTGATLWATDGVPASTASGYQNDPDIASDGSGGAIIVWNDFRVTGQVFAQRVSAAGVPSWQEDGAAISPTGGRGAQIVSDAEGGGIVAWSDGDVFAQRVDPSGAALWNPSGVALCTTPGSFDEVPRIESDGWGGAFVSWYDVDHYRAYAQHVDPAGVIHWGSTGAPVSTGSNYEFLPVPVSDGANGAIVTWADRSLDYTMEGLDAQRIGADGAPQWGDGIAVAPVGTGQINQSELTDGSGGALVAFEDARSGYPQNIYAQRLTATGARAWGDDGLALCTAPRLQGRPVAVTDGADGAIVSWEDFRDFNYPNPGDSSIYAQRVRGSGATAWPSQGVRVYSMPRDLVSAGSSASPFALEGVIPNPASGPFTVRFTLSAPGAASVEILDLLGRKMAHRSAVLGAGAYEWRMDAERRLAPGIYLVRLTQGGRRTVARAPSG